MLKDSASGDAHHLTLRIFRVIRCLRVLRLLRFLRVFPDLQLLSSCLLHCLGSFFWSLFLIIILVYLAAMYFCQLALFKRMEVSETSDAYIQLTEWYGSVTLSFRSLFHSLTGGIDWAAAVQPLGDHVSTATGV